MNDIQKRILDVFKVVDRICRDNHIPYFAIGGTCIGAVRHGGFIPWDDDIDIAIPIEYFSDFEKLCKKDLPDYLEYYDCSQVLHYPNIFSKVVDKRTTFIEEINIKYPDTYKGVFIDIMPIGGIPVEKKSKKKYLNLQHFYNIANNTRRFSFREMPNNKVKLIWLLLKPFNLVCGFDFWSNKWLSLIKKYPFTDSKNTGYVWSGRLKELIFSSSCFSGEVELKFEDINIKCPEGYDAYLKDQFGDYMKLPPKADRVSGHNGVIDLNCSYKDYQSRKNNLY